MDPEKSPKLRHNLTSDRQHIIGKSQQRVDGRHKVRGQTLFLEDLDLPGVLDAAPVYASIAHARLFRLDYSQIESDPDFVDLITAEDIPGDNQVGVIIEDQPLLVTDHIRYWGDCTAIVVARSRPSALRLARAVKHLYESLEPVFSIADARNLKPGLHESNLACEHVLDRGDIQAGFNAADVIVEVDLQTPVQEHYYLEPQACVVEPDGQGGLLVRGSLQCPYYIQKAVARNLKLSYAQVRVEQTPTGGAFGGKEDVPSEVCARAALAAWKLQKPVRMVYSRHDDMQLTSKRHPFEMHYRVGVSKAGKLLAADILLEEGAGAYATLSSVVSYRAAMQAMGPYVIPNIKVHSRSYYTNLPPNGAFRGFGSPQAAFGHERVMDHLAEKLAMDPLEFRLQNVVTVGAKSLTGQSLNSSVGAAETLRQARRHSDWSNSGKPGSNGRYLTGYGVAAIHYGNCLGAAGWALDGSAARIQLHRDGSVSVAFGLVEMGQGALTVVSQMTAEALKILPEQVCVLPTDTHQVPDSGPSVASRNVVMTGNAIREAARQLLPVIQESAASLMECKPAEIEMSDGIARHSATGKHTTLAEIANHMFLNNQDMESLGWWHVPPLEYDPETGQGEAYFTYSYATHIAKVAVDTVTGRVRVVKIWAAHDIGKAINPAGLEAQVEGGTAQGIGWALTENFKYHNGQVVADNLSTYLLPTAVDVGEIETIIIEDPEPLGPWGAKGIGEPAIIPTAAAIANAVSQAIGCPVDELPMHPESILNHLEKHAGGISRVAE